MGDGDARPFIIVSGLPASGKATLARALANGLDLPLIDKGDFLERLLDTKGVGDADWRRRLSRQSDQTFRIDAERSSGAVLT